MHGRICDTRRRYSALPSILTRKILSSRKRVSIEKLEFHHTISVMQETTKNIQRHINNINYLSLKPCTMKSSGLSAFGIY